METLLFVFLCLLMVLVQGQTSSRLINFDNFDDYLLTVGAPSQHNDVLKSEETTTAPSDTSSEPAQEEGLTYEDILGYFRDVPREHWSCCMLGMLAGNKGFHCNAAFYAQRIALRNTNRAHNRRLPFHGRDRIPHWGWEIIHTFSRCVLHHSSEFHQCCYAATVERQERIRWQQYRDFMTGGPVPDDQ